MQLHTSEEKKAFLNQYLECKKRIKRKEEDIEEIRVNKTSPSFNADGMPHGNDKNDLSGYASLLDEKERDLKKEIDKSCDVCKKISSEISKMADINERDILHYKYIDGKEWKEIANKFGYSIRHIYRLHGEALKHFKITKVGS